MSKRRAIPFAALTCIWLLGLELLGVEAAFATALAARAPPAPVGR
jgi:hypothetical protein